MTSSEEAPAGVGSLSEHIASKAWIGLRHTTAQAITMAELYNLALAFKDVIY
jgi:hypothetical protein